MTVTISRLFDDPQAAQMAVRDLEVAGIPARDISIVSSNADNWYRGDAKVKRKVDRDHDGTDDRAEGAAAGAGIGAALGGTAGVLAGLGIMAIPGLGPVVAAGWLAAAATAAVAGGAVGGIIGALTQAGVSKSDAEVYAEGIRRGGTLVTAKCADGDRVRCEAIMDQAAVNIRERELSWREAGWSGYDPNAKPYSADQIRVERETYRSRTLP